MAMPSAMFFISPGQKGKKKNKAKKKKKTHQKKPLEDLGKVSHFLAKGSEYHQLGHY